MTSTQIGSSLSWQVVGREKRESIAASLPKRWRLPSHSSRVETRNAIAVARECLTTREIEITEQHNVIRLAEKIADKTYTSVEVTEAFCHRATLAHQLTNCLSEVLFDDALKQAAALDEYLSANGTTVGPLHGVPISLKDQFRVRGAPTSVGFVSWLSTIETEHTESWLVKQLRTMGAVVFCKTNVPTSLMAIETNNNIVGLTVNAFNTDLSCGGSSGGEASLLAMRGSILGLGSDVGASIRLPCGFSDLVGLKPSHGRIPYLGIANSMEGHQTVESVIGPMAHTINDLRTITKLILATRPWTADPKVLSLSWRQDMEEEVSRNIKDKSMTVGVIRCDGMVTPHPPITHALNQAVEKLRANGVEVIEWDPPAHAEGFQILWDTFAADGGIDIFENLDAAGEPPVPEIAISYGQKLGHLPVGTVNSLWKTQKRKYDFQTRYLEYWSKSAALTKTGREVDAIICPVAPTCSYRPGGGRYFGYTGVWNVLDYSAVTVRTGFKVDKIHSEHQKLKHHVHLNGFDEEIMGQYDPELFNGMPIGLQVVCKRLEEEKVLRIAEEIQDVLLETAV